MVPVYNVEDYLAACLDSLAAQTFGELEVVLVDDGSTDGSAAIAERYADRHRAWILVRTDNHGLGAARNRGVAEASGDYLAFVDSDDLVPDFAYELMMSTLQDSSSDFVVGSIQQLVGDTVVEPEFLREAMAQRRIGVRPADVPAITRNVFACTKIFRRDFYDRAGIAFPEGVRYEDQPAMMRAYLLADRFDILRRPVYTWRVREAGTSITQGRGRLADLEDRLATKRLTGEVVDTHGDPVVKDFWGRLGVVGDLPVYFEQIPHVDDAYWTRLVAGVRELLAGRSPIEESRLRLPQRLVGYLVVSDRRHDAERVLGWLAAHPGPLRLVVQGDRVVAPDLPLTTNDDSDLPDLARRLGPHELVFDARLVDVRWEDADLVVRGWSVIRGAPTAGVETEIRVALDPLDTNPDGGFGGAAGPDRSAVQGVVTRFAAPDATRWIDRGEQSYDNSGFTVRLGLADWLAQPVAARGELVVTVQVQVAGLHDSGRLRSRADGLDPDALPSRPGAALAWRPGAGLVVSPR